MKNRRTLLIGVSICLAAATSACSSASSGPQSTSTADSSIGASGSADASGTDVTLPPGSGGGADSGGGSGDGSSTAPSTKHTTSSPKHTTTPTPAPTVQPQFVSVNYSTPGCKTTSGTSTVVLSWSTKDGTSVYLAESEVAFPFDPKTSGGAIGPLPPNGSKTVPYNCANDDDYYMVGVYNSVGQQYESDQIPNPAS